jgi:hypothetical protein
LSDFGRGGAWTRARWFIENQGCVMQLWINRATSEQAEVEGVKSDFIACRIEILTDELVRMRTCLINLNWDDKGILFRDHDRREEVKIFRCKY